jgi:hypothetical protein
MTKLLNSLVSSLFLFSEIGDPKPIYACNLKFLTENVEFLEKYFSIEIPRKKGLINLHIYEKDNLLPSYFFRDIELFYGPEVVSITTKNSVETEKGKVINYLPNNTAIYYNITGYNLIVYDENDKIFQGNYNICYGMQFVNYSTKDKNDLMTITCMSDMIVFPTGVTNLYVLNLL